MPDTLHESFDASLAATGTTYAHPQEGEILRVAKELLFKIPTGQRFVNALNTLNIPVKVVANREILYNIPDDKTIFLLVPNPAPKDLHVVALSLGLGVRDHEQISLGFRVKNKNVNDIKDQADLDVMFSKALDITMTMCKIAEEFEKHTGYSKLIEYVEKLGYGSIYGAFRSRKSFAEIETIYKGLVYEGKK